MEQKSPTVYGERDDLQESSRPLIIWNTIVKIAKIAKILLNATDNFRFQREREGEWESEDSLE